MNQDVLNIIQAISSIATAIGTVGAVILSLYFSIKNRTTKIKVSADIAYVPLDVKGNRLGHTISKDSVDVDVLKRIHSNFIEALRLTAINEGNVDVYINAFYFRCGIFLHKVLYIDSSKCIDSSGIGQCLPPGQQLTVLMKIHNLNSTYVKEYYKGLMFPKIQFRIAIETVLGKNFHNLVNKSVHKYILNNLNK